MPKFSDMNLSLNAAAAEGIMGVRRENAGLRARVAELEQALANKARPVEDFDVTPQQFADSCKSNPEANSPGMRLLLARVEELEAELEAERHDAKAVLGTVFSDRRGEGES